MTLAGSGSTTRTGATLTYAWTQTGGETVTLDDAASATPSFTAPSVRTDLAFSLAVNDGTHDSPPDTVTVRVRPPPNPSSAPCAHPREPGDGFLSSGYNVSSTDSSISFGLLSWDGGARTYDLWFCRPDGTRERRAAGVSHTHSETVTGLTSGTTYWVTVKHIRPGQPSAFGNWRAVTTTGAATIKRVAFANAPATGGTYVLGETIRSVRR